MNIDKDCVVALSYELKVDGQVADSATADKPLEFLYGHGQLLPLFEQNILGLSPGQTFSFSIPCREGYGESDPNAVMHLPKDIFIIDGVMQQDLLQVGKRLPMRAANDDMLFGTIVAIEEHEVVMDFNHPMAGKDLHFTGRVEAVRQATDDELSGCGGCCCGGHHGHCSDHGSCADHDHDGCGCGDGCCH